MSRKRKIYNPFSLLEEIKELCETHGIKPAHSKGQNFLINSEVYDRIVAEAQLGPNDVVVEVGPGLGYLTTRLAKSAKQVIAIELDHHLAGVLVNRFKLLELENIQVIQGDILRWPDLPQLTIPANYSIVSNLPYNITSFFLRQFLSVHRDRPSSMTLMLQDEVAKRLCPRLGEMSLLGLSAEFYAQVTYLFQVQPQDFWPAPKVKSAVVRLVLREQRLLDDTNEKLFFRLARVGFSAKRKMLKKNIMTGIKIDPEQLLSLMKQCNIDASVRAQDLSLDQWLKLFGQLKEFMV